MRHCSGPIGNWVQKDTLSVVSIIYTYSDAQGLEGAEGSFFEFASESFSLVLGAFINPA
jgi:hypothetical protein